MGYRDLRSCLAALEERGLLHRITHPVNKDTELMPLVRWQFRGLREPERKAFLFENVTDARGRSFDFRVVIGAIGASRAVYATAMDCDPKEINDRWRQALLRPIDPVITHEPAPCQEVVLTGSDLEGEGNGLDRIPVPISTPGFDPAPYFTAPFWFTVDPETGVRNVGTYRGMVKAPNRLGVLVHPAQHIGIMWAKYRKQGRRMPGALVTGALPALGMTSVAKLPYGMDEVAVAGGILGEPVPLVRCVTQPIEVPATAELVIEGEFTTEYLEPEAPFGEYTGYMGKRNPAPAFIVTAITHRRNPIYQGFISQMPPSESSMIRGISYEAGLYKLLKYDCNVPSVVDVAFHEASGSWNYTVIALKKSNPAQPWQALNAAAALDPTTGKITIAVDDDIDPHDPEAVNWALSFRMQPHRDLRVTMGKSSMLDPSAAPPGVPEPEARFPMPSGCSALLIDATRKWPYPPVSLPHRPYMERAKQLWEELGLPPLTPRQPWYGYELGDWEPENREEAALAVEGRYFETGEKLAGRRVDPSELGY